jgi:hypothetical protein
VSDEANYRATRRPRPDSSVPARRDASDLELRRLGAEIDRKLIICRGC